MEAGLFGVPPELLQQVIQEENEKRRADFAAANPYAQVGMLAGSAGESARGLLGGEDPRLKRAKELDAIKQEIAQFGITDEAQMFKVAAQKLREKGYLQEAMGAMKAGQELALKRAQEIKALRESPHKPGSFGEKVELFEQMKQRLAANPEDQNAKEMLGYIQGELAGTSQEKHLGGGVMQRKDGTTYINSSLRDALLAEKKAGKTDISIPISTEKKYGEQFAGKIAESDYNLREAATKAPDLAERALSIKKILDSGKVITGFGADYRLAFSKAMGLIGATDSETASNTELLFSTLARTTLDHIKESGLGAGQGFTNTDREFLEKAVAGKLNAEEKTLRQLAELSYRAAQKSGEKWNKRVKQIPRSSVEGTGIDTSSIIIPPFSNQWDLDKERRYEEWKKRQSK